MGPARDARVARAVEYAEKEFDGLVGPKFRAKAAALPVFPLSVREFKPDPKKGGSK